ncbi:MAG: TauD/TfdA family dioxygenase [Ilumatobacteraceae bacterium]
MTTLIEHATPAIIESPAWPHLDVPSVPLSDERFVRAAGHAARMIPAAVHDALVDFADAAPRSGAIVLRGLPVGELPATPDSPTAPTHKDLFSEFVLMIAARRLGQPVGYLPEHGGDLVQNLVPTKANADRQVSTSSGVDLMFHTEAAFHPHRPKFLLLLCLRGDERAITTLSSIQEVMPLLPARVVETLFQPRFRTAVDESYLHGRSNVLGAPMPVLSGNRERPTMIFDADLMVGVDAEADDALRALSAIVEAHHTGLALEAGDLLVVDNDVAVHGRSSYQPRWDGKDRWLQRAMAVTDLAASAGDRRGRVLVTEFGA